MQIGTAVAYVLVNVNMIQVGGTSIWLLQLVCYTVITPLRFSQSSP